MRSRYALFVVLAAIVLAARPAASETALTESGSTLLYPLLQVWVDAYTHDRPGVRVETRATGSGAGIADAAAGTVTFAASDAPLSDAQLHAGLMNVPLVVSAQAVNYNLPDVHAPLRLSGALLAGIYSRQITRWDDPRLAAMNPGVALPRHAIVPIRRSDGSGDTYLFTEYLTLSDPAWKARYGFGTRVKWPGNELAAKGNAAMVETCVLTPYSLAYVGISFYEQARARGLGVAVLRNRDGAMVEPTAPSIQAAARQAAALTDQYGRASLVFLPGRDTYPIVNYEYAIFRKPQDAETANALAAFLRWVLEHGSVPSFLDAVHFEPLPSAVAAESARRLGALESHS